MDRKLMSQGEVRPGVMQGQFWMSSSSMFGVERTAGIPVSARKRHPNVDAVELLKGRGYSHVDAVRLVTQPTPRSHADPRLSNRVER